MTPANVMILTPVQRAAGDARSYADRLRHR